MQHDGETDELSGEPSRDESAASDGADPRRAPRALLLGLAIAAVLWLVIAAAFMLD